jgi:superfamily I DNA and/or RNA helicase
MLQEQYRMHPYLLEVPNKMFYEGKIVSNYKQSIMNKFIDTDLPLLFINVDHPEQGYGTSFINKGEVNVIKDFASELFTQGYPKEKFGIVSPYLG